MARLRFLTVSLLALVFVGNPTQTGRSAGQSKPTAYTDSFAGTKTTAADDGSCTIYALADRGFDAGLGQWIAQTIPEMIEPSSWQTTGGTGTLRYYAPKNILIIKNSAAIHAKVDGFLKDLKKSLPKGNEGRSATGRKSPRAGVVPATYQAPATLLPASGPVNEASSYPVPAPVKAPKHLFHFLIRYEGEGIIDDNVVKFMKTYSESEKETTVRHGFYPSGAATPLSSVPAAGPPERCVYPSRAATPLSTVPIAVGPLGTGAAETKANDSKKKGDKKDEEKVGKEPY